MPAGTIPSRCPWRLPTHRKISSCFYNQTDGECQQTLLNAVLQPGAPSHVHANNSQPQPAILHSCSAHPQHPSDTHLSIPSPPIGPHLEGVHPEHFPHPTEDPHLRAACEAARCKGGHVGFASPIKPSTDYSLGKPSSAAPRALTQSCAVLEL